jgi:uncharacterized Rmd1/YagE family protein
MELFTFKAFAFGGELDLNRLAVKLGITRKYRWEEPMKLNPVTFAPATGSDAERVYLYYFGGVVFLNCSGDIIARFLDSIPQYAESLKGQIQLPYREEYRLEIDPGREPAISNDCAIMPRYNLAFLEIICFVIAKSGRGKLELPDRDMARLASSILSFKFTSIAHIMVLDKPDITWDNPEADRLYTTMASLFELSQRYLEIKHKSETLLDMTDVFSGLSHARRSARLEWIIIILIAIEIVIYLMQLYRGQ